MKRQKVNDEENDYDKEVPANIQNNLSADEIILYKSKGFNNPSSTKFIKFAVPILQIAIIIELLILFQIVKREIDMIINIFIFGSSILMWIYWVFLVKLNILSSINYFIFSNRAVYVYHHSRRFFSSNKSETLEKIELSSLKAILLRKLKKKKDLVPNGLIDFIYPKESNLKFITDPTNRMAIGETNDVLLKYNIIESIMWVYQDVKGRIDTIIKELNLSKPPEISPTSQECIRLKKRVRNHNIVLGIGILNFIFCTIFISLGNNIVSLICIFGIIASLTLVIFIASFDIHIRQVVPSSDGMIQITPEGLKYINEKRTIIFNFNSNIGFDFKIIPNKMSENFTYIGTITIQSFDNPDLKVKFGPTIEIIKVLELLYLSYLSWKNHHQLLLNEEEILSLRNQKSMVKSKESIKRKIDSSPIVDTISSQKFGLSEEQEDNVKKVLNTNEKVLTIYQHERKTYILLIYLIIFSVGVILILFSIWSVLEFLFMMPNFVITFTFGMTIIIFTTISLYNYVFINRIYIFTNQKLILKIFKKYYQVPYKDISIILLNEGRKSNVIHVNFNADSEIKVRRKINNISLPIKKESDLYDKIISYKKSFI